MKNLFYLIAFAIIAFTACGDETSSKPFTLEITSIKGCDTVIYMLSDSGLWLDIHHTCAVSDARTDDGTTRFYLVSGLDSLKYIAELDIEAYSCQEQHALMVTKVVFTNDSGPVDVNPYSNHPKELDIAVRIINALVEENYRLHYEHVQSAIEPVDKLNV